MLCYVMLNERGAYRDTDEVNPTMYYRLQRPAARVSCKVYLPTDVPDTLELYHF